MAGARTADARARCAEAARRRHGRDAAAKLAAGKPPCAHCRARPAGRPRQLCWTCYYTPGVLALYPPAARPRTTPEKPHCWACNVPAPHQHLRKIGWASRRIKVCGYVMTECYCGPCHIRWGWPPLPEDREAS